MAFLRLSPKRPDIPSQWRSELQTTPELSERQLEVISNGGNQALVVEATVAGAP